MPGLLRRLTLPRWPLPVPTVRPLADRAVAVVSAVGPGLLFLLVLGLWTATYLVRLLRDVVLFPGHEGDGPFQMFNPLRRIAAGQAGGADFAYFHGLGLPYLHYPVFAAAGGDVFAAELARHVVALGVFLGAAFAVALGVTRQLVPALGLTAAAAVLCEQLGLDHLVLAGNASMGVRSAGPLVVLAVLLAGFRPRVEAVAVGLVGGVGLLTGTEHGVAAGAMVGTAWLVRRLSGQPGGTLAWAATAAGVALGTAGALLLLVGGPAGAVAALRYAFVELPQDQFWYFGVPPNPFHHRWADLLTDRPLLVRGVGPLLAVAVVAVGRLRTDPAAGPVLGLAVYGLLAGVSYLGYASPHYLDPLTRAAIAGGLVLGWRAVADSAEARRTAGWVGVIAAAVLLLAGASITGRSSVFDLSAVARDLRDGFGAVRRGECRMAPNLEAELREMVAAVDADRAARGVTRPPVLWSVYAGRLEAHYGVFHPCCDYAIHALGPARRAGYVAAFRDSQPDYVVTCRTPRFGYEEWLRNSTWGWYEELLANYEPFSTGERFVIWRRAAADWRSPDREAGRITLAPEGPDRFTVPAPPGCAADAPRVVEVEYTVRNRLAGIPVVGGLPRHLLGAVDCQNQTPVSLPPGQTSWSFPVFPSPGKTPTFFAGTFSLVGGQVTITRVHVRPLAATREQIEALTR